MFKGRCKKKKSHSGPTQLPLGLFKQLYLNSTPAGAVFQKLKFLLFIFFQPNQTYLVQNILSLTYCTFSIDMCLLCSSEPKSNHSPAVPFTFNVLLLAYSHFFLQRDMMFWMALLY